MTKEQNFLALDLEFNRPSRKIIQVGIALATASQPEGEYLVCKWDVKIDEPIDPEITQLTGITTEMNQAGLEIEVVAQELSAVIAEKQPFVNPVTWGGGDSDALLAAFANAGADFPHFGRRWIDVKTLTAFLAISHASGPRSASGGLGSIMARYKLQFKGAPHRADVDSFNTLRLFFCLVRRQKVLETAAEQIREFT